jgi:hypothetical protein
VFFFHSCNTPVSSLEMLHDKVEERTVYSRSVSSLLILMLFVNQQMAEAFYCSASGSFHLSIIQTV